MSEDQEIDDNELLDFSPIPLLNSTMADTSATDQNFENANSTLTVQYITERLIKKITRQENIWMIRTLNLTLTSKGTYIKKIKRIENLDNVKEVEDLSLSHNIIEKIENLEHLKKLRILNLSFNLIGKIENISSLMNLEVLDLSHNEISLLPYKIFKHLQRIKKLDVSHNKIAEIKQIRDMRLLGNLVDFSFHDNPVVTMAPHATDTAVFYLRGLELLDGAPVSGAMRASADTRYQQDEVNAMQDEILDKSRLIDAVSREREEVIRALEDKKSVEDKLRRSGNTSMLKISELEEELTNTKQLLEARTNELTAACYKHYALEQELSMYKVDARFKDMGPPPFMQDTEVKDHVEESGYVSKAPLYPVQYGSIPPGHSQNMEHYRDYDYTEQVPDDDKVQLLEQKILDNEREKRNIERQLADNEKELEEREGEIGDIKSRLDDIGKQLAEEARLRQELETELGLKNRELDTLRGVEGRLRDAQTEVEDLHGSLQRRVDEVKDLRNQLEVAKPKGLEKEHMQARLKKKEGDLEKERRAYEDAKREFQEKQRELQKRIPTRSSEDPRLREEHEALLGKLRDLEGQLEEAVEEREGLEGELDAVKRDEDVLRRDVNIVQKMFADKETETEALHDELDKTRDLVDMLKDENRKLKDEAVQLLEGSPHPENEVLQETLDELGDVQAENARLVRERSVHSPYLVRQALRRSKDKVADLQDENAELRDILNESRGDKIDPDEVARRILSFLEDRLPKTPVQSPVSQNVDLIPIIKLLLEERDKKRDYSADPQDLIKLLEDLIKDRSRNPSPSPPPVINVNIPEQSPRVDDSIISERYLRSSPAKSPRVYIHESPDDPDVIHVVSRRAQTDTDTTINIGAAECRHKRKRVVITDGETEACDGSDILIVDRRKDQATNTNIHSLADEMLNKFEKSAREREDSENQRRMAEKERKKIDRLMDEVASLRQGIREAATQTNVNVLDNVQRKLDEALTRTNSLSSCGHEELISYLKSSLSAAEREVDHMRNMVQDREADQETALTEMKIDGLGETLRDHNRSLHNLQEVLRDAVMTSSRDKQRDVIIQPPPGADTQTSVEIRDIQKTLLELQYSLKYAADQNKPEKSDDHYHSTQCLHCANCKRTDMELEMELRRVKQELSESKVARAESGDLEKLRESTRTEREQLDKLRGELRGEKATLDKLHTEARGERVGLEKLRADHTTILIDMERIRAERNHINDVLVQYKTQLEDVEHDKRTRYHELLEINERVAQSERSAAEAQAAEKRALDALQAEAHDLKKTISELNLQREHILREAAQTQQQLKQDKQAFEEEMKHKKKLFEHTAKSANIRKEEELVHLDTKLRDRATQLEKVDDDIRSRNECLHRLRLDVEQNTKQNEMLQLSLDKQIEKKKEEICQQEDNIRDLAAQLTDLNERRDMAERQLKAFVKDISCFQDSIKQLESEKEEKESNIQSLVQKLKLTQTKLINAKNDLDDVLRESDTIKVDSTRQQDTLTSLVAEISTLTEKKQRRKDKLKQLELESEQLDRAIREKKAGCADHTTRRNDLEKEVKELDCQQKLFSDNVECLGNEIRKLERQKQEELQKLGELKSSFELIKNKREQLQESFTIDEERMRDAVKRLDDHRESLEDIVKTLQQKVAELDKDITQKSDCLSRLSEEEERAKCELAELEVSKVAATNELDEHLTSAVKEKYTLSTAITALKREKDSLKVQHDKLLDELVKMRSESAALRDRISTDKVTCEELQTSCNNSEQQYKDYCALSEQAVQQMNNLHRNIVHVEKDLHNKRVELRDVITKQEDIQSLLQAKQDKLGVAEQKLLSYNQRLSNIKTTLESNQSSISSLANKKLDLENELASIKRDIECLESVKARTNDEHVAQKQSLDNLRKDLASCQKQHKQEMAKYNKLMREKNKYDSDVKSSKVQCETYAKNIDRMKEDEVEMRGRMRCLARDLADVDQEFKEKSANLRSVEELKNQTSYLDNEIKQKSEVLSQYTDKLDEINKLKDSAVEKEHLLKDSETKVANLQNQISEITKMSEEKQNSDSIANNGLKKNLKRLKKHLHVQMDSSTLLRKELAEQAATARTLELDLQAQRDAHNSVLSMLEEDNSCLHNKCEEQLLEIETLRLELAAARHSLGTKQAELTFVAEDLFDKSVSEDMVTNLTAMDNRQDILVRSNGSTEEFLPSKRWRAGRRVVDNINYKYNQIDSTIKQSPLRATYSFNSEFHKTVEDDVSGATNKSSPQTQGHTNQHLEATDQSNIVLTNELSTDPSPFNEEDHRTDQQTVFSDRHTVR